MEYKILKVLFSLFAFHFLSFSFASESDELIGKVEIISNYKEPEDPEDSGLPPGQDAIERLGGIVEAKDGSSYMFYLRNNKISYFKKSGPKDEWSDETFANVADGLPEVVFTETYPKDLIDDFVYSFGDSKVAIVLHDSFNFAEVRTLTVDLSSMTLVKNEVTVPSTADLYKEYKEQDAPPPTPGPQIPMGVEISRISTLKDSKLIYYYSTLERQEDRRIVRKRYYRFNVNGVWSQAYEAKEFPIPANISKSYRHDETMLLYGDDVTKDRVALIGMARDYDNTEDIPTYVFLMYQETATGEISLRVVDDNLEHFSPSLPEDSLGPYWAGFYNSKTSEVSISAHSQAFTSDQVFSVYSMKEKKLIKTRTVTQPEGFSAMFMAGTLTEDGESIGLLKSRKNDGEANFYFVKWSGSGEQKYYKISKGPVPGFSTPWSPMIWSADKTKIYTSDQSGTVCETNLTEGSLRCSSPNLEEATGIEGLDAGSGGILRLTQKGVLEVISSTSWWDKDRNRHRVVYSYSVDFN